MMQELISSASRLLDELSFVVSRRRGFSHNGGKNPPTVRYAPLQRVILSDGVARTLFESYTSHRKEARGSEETGWVLLGLREAHEAIVLATLPAGAHRDAGVAHVQFNSEAQAVGSRIVRLNDRRLTILGVVHTHPGTLRHPSEGDLRGDRKWVRHLRGREGVFAIGTADAHHADNGASTPGLYAVQPRPNVQSLGELCFSWYSLRAEDADYRPLPVGLTIGPDLARDLHLVWSALEQQAGRIERLFQQQTGLHAEVVSGPGLLLTLPLTDRGGTVRVLVSDTVRYYLERGGEWLEVDHHDDQLDRGVYLLLANLAAQAG
jgi:Prokaryotic homologs of the JAB domain